MSKKVICVFNPDTCRSIWYYISSTGRSSCIAASEALRLIVKAISEKHSKFADVYILP